MIRFHLNGDAVEARAQPTDRLSHVLPETLGPSNDVSPGPVLAAAQPTARPLLQDLIGLPLAQIERRVIEETLAHHGGSVSRAARVLEVSPSTLYRKIESWAKS